MHWGERWWPGEFGKAAISGAQNGVRFAFFPAQHRLLIETEGNLQTYDSADHVISGVYQQSGSSNRLDFLSQYGTVNLATLRKLS
jgi:hypothetical protein